MQAFASIEKALVELQEGRMLILVDDDRREQEGDLIIAAEKASPEAINFMLKYARGFVCLSLPEETLDKFNIPLMNERKKLPHQAAFTVSVEAAEGVTTGTSVFDRAHTIKVMMDPHSTREDISLPGHVFPLKARRGGVLERQGHTEGSVDLTQLAGLKPGAVICEIMNEDGSMARMPELSVFAKEHGISIVSINDLVAYRLAHESVIEELASADLPSTFSQDFVIKVFRHRYDLSEHIAIVHKQYDPHSVCTVRLHSECVTGDTFGSLLCDCGAQLHQSLEQIAAEKGILLYMRQEGRGIGLSNKIKAYHLQQTLGLDTVEANHKLGFLADHRHYGMSAQILHHLGVREIRLMTNNPRKLQDLESFGIRVLERLPLDVGSLCQNQAYLKTKRDKLGHILNITNN